MEMTKELIMEACRTLIREYGLQHMLMDEVARRCGVSKKTIYELFGSKEALMEALAINYLEGEKASFYQGLGQQPTLPEKISFIIQYGVQLGEFIPFEEWEYLRKKFSLNYRMLHLFWEEIWLQLQQLLHEGKRGGSIKASFDIELQLELLLAQLQYLHRYARQLLQQRPIAAWQQQIIANFLYISMLLQ